MKQQRLSNWIMACLIPHLIRLITWALSHKKYPNLYSVGEKSFYLYCPRKGSKDFTHENIQLFKVWDTSKRRRFNYSKSRQRVLSALRRSVYLTLVYSGENYYVFRFNEDHEISAKREALKNKHLSNNYTSDGESLPPSSPEFPPSPYDVLSIHSPIKFMDSHEEMDLSQVPVQFPEVSDLHLPNESVSMPLNNGLSYPESSFPEATGSQQNVTSLGTMQPLTVDCNAGQLISLGLENSRDVMETCTKPVDTTQESAFTPFEYKDLSLGDELSDISDGIPVNQEYPVSQPPSSGAVGERLPQRSNEYLVVDDSALWRDSGSPRIPYEGNTVLLHINEILTTGGNVQSYLISLQKVSGIPH